MERQKMRQREMCMSTCLHAMKSRDMLLGSTRQLRGRSLRPSVSCVCVCGYIFISLFHTLSSTVQAAVLAVNQGVESGGLTAILRALQGEDLALSNVDPRNIQWYKNILAKARKDKEEVRCLMHTHKHTQLLLSAWTCYSPPSLPPSLSL